MKYIDLNNGLKMPIIGFGTASLKGEECYSAVLKSIKLGYKMIDTAHMYMNEDQVGRAINDSNIKRSDLFIVSKVDRRSNSYELTKKQIDKSLNALGVEYIDLYLIHEPYDESIEMYKALEEAYQEGKLKAIGISNFFGRRYNKFIKACNITPAINQLECHPYLQQSKNQELMGEVGIKLMSWSPFAGGKVNFNDDEVLLTLARKYNKSVYQIILAYLMARDIIVIPRTDKEEKMKLNLESIDIELTKDDIEVIKSIDKDTTLFSWTLEFK